MPSNRLLASLSRADYRLLDRILKRLIFPYVLSFSHQSLVERVFPREWLCLRCSKRGQRA